MSLLLSRYKSSFFFKDLKSAANGLEYFNLVHSRRKTISEVPFSYFDEIGNFLLEKFEASPLRNLLTNLTSLTSLAKFEEDEIILIPIYLRNILRVMDDRVNLLWSAKFNSSKICLALTAIIYKEIVELDNLMIKFSQAATTTGVSLPERSQTFYVATHIRKFHLPLLCEKLKIVIDRSVFSISAEPIKSYLRANCAEFLVYSKSKSSDEVAGDRFLALLSCSTIKDIFGQFVFKLRFERDHIVSLVTVVFNALLHSLLDALLEERPAFDEAGLYRLFRIILRLQNFAIDIKSMLKSMDPNCLREKDRIFSDLNGWKRAERAIAVLNAEIFRDAIAQRNSSRGGCSQTNRFRVLRYFCSKVNSTAEADGRAKTIDNGVFGGMDNIPQFPAGVREKLKVIRADKQSSEQYLENTTSQSISMNSDPPLLLPVARRSWSMQEPGPGPGPGPGLRPGQSQRQRQEAEDEERKWAQLAARSSSRGRGFLGFMHWRRSHRGTVFVELSIDVSDI